MAYKSIDVGLRVIHDDEKNVWHFVLVDQENNDTSYGCFTLSVREAVLIKEHGTQFQQDIEDLVVVYLSKLTGVHEAVIRALYRRDCPDWPK